MAKLTEQQGSPVVLDQLLTPQQVAEYRGTTTGVLAQERFNRTGPRYVRDGRRIRYRASDIRAYIESSTVEH
jgi:predicted DNA-binding transcriptional regulator AlpA